MARKIKFALEMADGTFVSNLEDLLKHVKTNDDVKKLVEYFLDGRLQKWFLVRNYDEESKALKLLNKNDSDFACRLCKAIGTDYIPVDNVKVELIEYEKRMRKALEEVTSDSELIANAGCTASNQSDLDFLIKNGKKTIYLWGDFFTLYVVDNIFYIGVLGKPSVAIKRVRLVISNSCIIQTLVDNSLDDIDIINNYHIQLENVVLTRFSNPFTNANVGDCVKMGSYPQNKHGYFDPIEWQVLAKENNKMLVISRFGLDCKRFDSSSNNWKNSEIRKWLNNDFYNKAFSEKERKNINSFDGDNVFLLSYDEAKIYFVDADSRRCKATEYAVKNGTYVDNNGYSWWWLRSLNPNDSDRVYYVYDDGSINDFYVYNTKFVLRPALWINLDCEQDILYLKDELSEQIPNYNKQPQKQNSVNFNFFKKANFGDSVKFGNYLQSANGDIHPIDWQVLSKENNKILVISKYGLDCKIFDSSSNNWSDSEIRKWLNGEFYNKAFNEKERKYINSSNLSDVSTTDNVFLLSLDEANKYFANDIARLCKATDYAKNNGAYVWSTNGCSWWWLRSSLYPRNVNYVYDVSSGGYFSFYSVHNIGILVRPALWINL